MNKYQEAINRLWDFVELHSNDSPKDLYDSLEDLQELVDKEKPMKAKWQGTESQGATFYYSYCPKCNEAATKHQNIYCSHCGQKLDWGDNDE